MKQNKTKKQANTLKDPYTCLGFKLKWKMKIVNVNANAYLTPSKLAWYGLEASCRVGYTEDKGNIQRWRGCCGRVKLVGSYWPGMTSTGTEAYNSRRSL